MAASLVSMWDGRGAGILQIQLPPLSTCVYIYIHQYMALAYITAEFILVVVYNGKPRYKNTTVVTMSIHRQKVNTHNVHI